MFSYLLGKKKGEGEVFDTSDIREVINMTDANVTAGTPFTQYPQRLYDGYINVLKDSDVLLDNMNIGDSTGTTQDAANLPIYNYKATKESTQFTTTGKNLANNNTNSTSIGGVNFTIEKGIIKINGTTSGYEDVFFDSFQANSGNAVFWVEVAGYTDKPTGNSSIILQQSDDGISDWTTFSEILLIFNQPKERNITLNSSKYYRLRWYTDNNTFTNATIKVMLEYGDVKTSWEPFTGGIAAPNPEFPENINVVTGDVDINVVGKNLFDEAILNTLKNNEDSECYIFNNNKLYNQNLTPNVNFKENTQYTIQYVGKQVSGSPRLAIKYTDGTLQDIETNSISTSLTKYTQISIANKTIDYITGNYGSNTTNGFYIKKDSVCLVEGIDTQYEPYQGQTATVSLGDNEIAGIGDYKDELIIDKAGHCYINKKIGKVVLNGSESGWEYYSSSTRPFKSPNLNIALPENQSVIPALLSNYFISSPWSQVSSGKYDMSMNDSEKKLRFKDTDINSLEDFKTWLSTHNTTVYYVLDEPTLINLHQTVDVDLSDGYNYITNSEDMNMEIKYIKNTYN